MKNSIAFKRTIKGNTNPTVSIEESIMTLEINANSFDQKLILTRKHSNSKGITNRRREFQVHIVQKAIKAPKTHLISTNPQTILVQAKLWSAILEMTVHIFHTKNVHIVKLNFIVQIH